MKLKPPIAVILIMLILVSCNKSSREESTDTHMATLTDAEQLSTRESDQIPLPHTQQQNDSIVQPPQVRTVVNIDWDKKIIKTAALRFEVKDFTFYNNLAHKTVRQYGGYVSQEDNDLSDVKSEATLAIKVPVSQFEELMNALSNTNAKLIERKISSEDVTGEVIDTKSRLEAKKQMRQKYLEFLQQSKNMKEVLEVQSEINGIQEEIEAASARIGMLSHQAAYSTINLSFFQPLSGYNPDPGTASFFSRASAAFKAGAEWIKNLFISLIYIWPLLLVTGFAFIVFKRRQSAKIAPINSHV